MKLDRILRLRRAPLRLLLSTMVDTWERSVDYCVDQLTKEVKNE